MNGDEILAVLRQIHGEARQTNQRLESLEGRVEQTNQRLESLEGRVEQTNQRLESLEGRVEFFEKRATRQFEIVSERIEEHVQRIDTLTRRQTDSELRLASEVLSLADVTREVRDLLSSKLDDHQTVIDHEERLRSLENQIADRPPGDR
jgi:chromosome segregation ATPase